jgi:hypothetical protein
MDTIAIAAAILYLKRLDDERADRQAFARAEEPPAMSTCRLALRPRVHQR